MNTAAEIVADRYFQRMTVVCARCWGMPPFAIVINGESGKIALEDAIECWIEQDWITGGVVHQWMKREQIAERKERNQKIEQLAKLANAAADPETRARIIKQMEEINHG